MGSLEKYIKPKYFVYIFKSVIKPKLFNATDGGKGIFIDLKFLYKNIPVFCGQWNNSDNYVLNTFIKT